MSYLFSISELHRFTGNQRNIDNLYILEVKKCSGVKNIAKSLLLQSNPDAYSKKIIWYLLRVLLEVPLKQKLAHNSYSNLIPFYLHVIKINLYGLWCLSIKNICWVFCFERDWIENFWFYLVKFSKSDNLGSFFPVEGEKNKKKLGATNLLCYT